MQGISTSLIITSSGSRDRDYHAQFRIRGVRGNITVADFPVNLVEDVQGDVSIDTLREFANSGAHYSNGTQMSYVDRPLRSRCVNIRGNLHARIGRMSVELQEIHGRMDVQNDSGDTMLMVSQPLSDGPHRLSSVSGRVEVNAERAALDKLAFLIATSSGTTRINAGSFPDFHISTGQGDGRDWRGFSRAPDKADEKGQARSMGDIFDLVDVLQGKTQPPGLVVVSQVGTVVFNLRKP